MYTLRTITPDNVVTNISLGKVYSTNCRFTSRESFENFYKELFGEYHVADLDETSTESSRNCKMIIKTLDGLYPIYNTNESYIMTEGGQTFEKL